MIKPHISLSISPNEKMQFQAEMFLRSLEMFGNCKDYYCSLFVPEDDPRQVTNKFIIDRAEIISYTVNKIYKYSWSECPRWNCKPKSDVSLIIDVDVLVLKDINPFLQMCQDQQNLMGVMAKHCPFDNKEKSLDIWKDLFELCDVKFPNKLYTYRNQDLPCPFYINHGVIIMPSDHLIKTKEVISTILEKLNSKIHDNRFLGQIATAIAFVKLKIPCMAVDLKYNSLGKDEYDTIFYHYFLKPSSMKEMKTLPPIKNGKINFNYFIKIL